MSQPKALDDIVEDGGGSVEQVSEMAEVFNNLDNSKIDNKTKLNPIDLNSRLTGFQIKNLMIFDELQNLGIIEEDMKLSVMCKRLEVSNSGLGRLEKVRIATAQREKELGGGGIGGVFNRMFARKEEPGQQ